MRSFLYEFSVEVMVWLILQPLWLGLSMTGSETAGASLQSSCFYSELGSGKEFETGVLLKSSAAGEIQASPQSRKHISFPSSPPFQIFCQFFMLSETKGKPFGKGARSPNSRTTRQSVKGSVRSWKD